MIKIYITEL